MKAKSGLAAACLCAILSACGGGGNSSAPVAPPPAAPNQVPTASTTGNQTVNEGQAVVLTGSGSDRDGRITSYQWTQVAGPAVTLVNATSATARFTAPPVTVQQQLVFELIVTDDRGSHSLPSATTVFVNDVPGFNAAPVANAGADMSVVAGASVTLNGSATDADGSIASYHWIQIAGPTVTLANASTASASFTAPSPMAITQLRFRLSVIDNGGASATDDVQVTVNPLPPPANVAPTAQAGADQAVNEGAAVTLHGAGTDSDGTIASYAWTQTAGPAVTLTGASTASPWFTAPQVDDDITLAFRLTVADDDGATATDDITITVEDAVTVGTLSPDALLNALLRGCDVLDTANCLFPFPNDHFTVAAAAGSPQSKALGGTGRRINLGALSTPRNLVGKPVDPTEWNRNDGFSPGSLITTYVPGLSLERTYNRPSSQVGLADISLSQHDTPDEDVPVMVLEVPQAPQTTPREMPVWAEIDANAGLLVPTAFPLIGDIPGDDIQRSGESKAALLIRPAVNFSEGRRYVVVLRRLRNATGVRLDAQAGFASCRDKLAALTPPLSTRCAELESSVFPVLEAAGIARDNNLYLAWDFTVGSTQNQIGRMRHMRDDAFKTISSSPATDDCTQYRDGAPCGTPQFTVDKVTDNPQSGIARRIEGTLTVPSFMLPADASPLEDPLLTAAFDQLCASLPAQAPQEMRDGCASFVEGSNVGRALSLPPNHLAYLPDALNPSDPAGNLYGDGMPDRTGTMQTRYICQIPQQATPDSPARAGIYGHGLLDSRGAVTYDGVPEMSREFNYMFCAVDFFGFSTGDLANVGLALVDLSNFRAIPDASQQGFLNFMFLARLLRDPRGFASDPAFQQAGSQRPLFDFRDVFYDGNSQGGILGGAIIATSKDVHRGVLGSPGMNYANLLTRSTDFDQYAGPLYLSYQDPLDRQLLFAMIPMLWDRSENDGYAAHLTDNSALGGDPKVVKVDPQFGDHQVTMYSAANMARTMGIPYDTRQSARISARPGIDGSARQAALASVRYGLTELDYTGAQANGGAMIVWDDPASQVPPINNTPPRTGRDPHDDSAKKFYGRCSKAHFLRSGGKLVDVTDIEYGNGTATCPAVPPALPVPRIEARHEVSLADVLSQLVSGLNAAFSALAQGDFQSFVGHLQAASGGVAGGLLNLVAQNTGDTLPAQQPGAPEDQTIAPLQAGAAKGVIRVPVGAPLGGYLRPPVGGEYIPTFLPFADGDPLPFLRELADFIPSVDDNGEPLAPVPDELRKLHSPYATFSPPSRGYYDSLIAKAVAMYDGHDYVVLVKTDFVGMIDEVVQDVRAEVKRRKGIDLGDGLVMSGTHTHDGPGAIGNHSLRYFWLALDAYQPELYERIVPQLADVVIAALDNMAPAQFGYATGQEDNRNPFNGGPQPLNSFRRGRATGYDLDCNDDGLCDDGLRQRIGVLRVDRLGATGPEPLALVMNYAAHGIAFDVENQYYSGDVLASAEREVEQGFNSPVIAMLVQNTGGDVSPRADGGPALQVIERFGKLLAPQVRAVYDGVSNFELRPDIRAVSQRIVLSRQRLGYTGNEFPYEWGAAQCNNDAKVPFIPGGPGLDGKIPYCLPAPPPDANDLADNGVGENGAFVPQDTRVTAVKIGRAMLLAQPGEPLSEYGVRVLKAAREVGHQPQDTFIWGYSQDHVGYIMPPSEEDWLRGGTEGTTTFWGWKLGQRLIDVNRVLAQALQTNTAPPPDEFKLAYTYAPFYKLLPAPVPLPSARPGRTVVQPQAIARFLQTTFSWEGGDPVVDLPTVALQVRNGAGAWQAARRRNGEPIDTYFEMHLKYKLATAAHLWTVELEPPRDWPAGTYRFSVSGTAFQGGNVAYSVQSKAFEVRAAQTLQLSAPMRDGAFVEATLAYEPRPNNYRVVDPLIPVDQPAPVREGVVAFVSATETQLVDRPTITVRDGRFVAVYRARIAGDVSAYGVDVYGNTTPEPPPPDLGTVGYGSGVIGALAGFMHDINGVLMSLISGDTTGASTQLQNAITLFSGNLGDTLGGDQASVLALLQNAFATLQSDPTQVAQSLGNGLGALLGLDTDVLTAATRAIKAERNAEAVVLTGASIPAWSVPPAFGSPYPYPSGATITGEWLPEELQKNGGRSAHNGVMIYPITGAPMGKPADRIAAYRWNGSAFVEIPVQVDQKFPYFLANSGSDFSVYSGTDEELTYEWDRERWQNDNDPANACNAGYGQGMRDPVTGLDADDEIVFMAQDAGPMAPVGQKPSDPNLDPAETVQQVVLTDALNPSYQRYVYLGIKRSGSLPAYANTEVYVRYRRDTNADQWIDRSFFDDSDPEKIGTSNTGYGPNRSGTVCGNGLPATQRASTDRFPRDYTTVATDAYRWRATGRWMVRDIRVAKPNKPGNYGPDLIDRWKGRAFQQSPDSNISIVGFEDEQVNWEANATLLGDRTGPVRAIREVWGADSGTNVTKVETFYRDAVSYRYRVRVHPIPPDGLYTSWDYNRSAMVPAAGEAVPGGRYYTALRPQGVPIDGQNDDIGQIDGITPIPTPEGPMCISADASGLVPPNPEGRCPAFFDVADATFNLPLAFDNWEQVSGKGNSGSLVYTFELTGATSVANPLVVPYYRDDACLDDGTGDDPVQRPYPGEAQTDMRVRRGYVAAAGGDGNAPDASINAQFAALPCSAKQGAYAAHGVHYFVTHDSDNAFVYGKPIDEIDGRQWQFAVPTDKPTNVGERYANIVRVPLVPVVTPLIAAP